jgi:hypothetical protein
MRLVAREYLSLCVRKSQLCIARLADEAAIEAPATLVVGDVVAATSIVIDSFRHNSPQGGSSQAAPSVAMAQPG